MNIAASQAAGEDAAEDAGLHGRDAHDRTGLDVPDPRHDAHGGEHHQVADRGGDGGDAVVLGEAERDADGEDQRQVGEDHVARVLHQSAKRVPESMEVGRADAQQQTRDRQHRDRQHQGLADFLQECESVLKHVYTRFVRRR